MNAVDELAPLLVELSDTDKDALIARLWRDLQAERRRSGEREHPGAGAPAKGVLKASSLAEKLQQAAAGRRAVRQLPATRRDGLGRGFAFMRSSSFIMAAGVVALAFALDFAVARYQQYRLEQKRLAELRLKHAAFEGMFGEVVNVAYEPDRTSYRLTMKLTNVGHPLFVMQSPVRVFAQSGMSWKEVPARDSQGQTVRVIKLEDSYTFETVFEPNLAEWAKLIPGYMHIRFETNSLVSQRSDPDDDVIDRTDRYYVYLKPHGADDDAIRTRMQIRGHPPVYMPMPPH